MQQIKMRKTEDEEEEKIKPELCKRKKKWTCTRS